MHSLKYLMPKEDAPRKYPLPIVPDDISETENDLIAPLPRHLVLQSIQTRTPISSSSNNNNNTNHRNNHNAAAVDDASLALALRLQEEEERRLESIRLQDDFHYAQSLQQRFEEEEQANSADNDEQEDEELLHKTTTSPFSLLPSPRWQGKSRKVMKRTTYLNKTPAKLAECQLKALAFVQQKARQMHQETLPALQQRVQELGYSEAALNQCLEYIRDDAPIIIHLKEPTLASLAKDTHYRNLFETGTSGGKNCPRTRQRWEAALFGNSYGKHCDGALRPKYACLNITGDVQGCYPARHYGDLYITLCKHVRKRVTMSDDDTGRNHQDALATCDAYAHVLARYDDTDLRAVLDVASTRVRRIRGAPSRSSTYKECQIHGPVDLRTDVEALSVPARQEEASEELHRIVHDFQRLTNCNVIWQMDLFS